MQKSNIKSQNGGRGERKEEGMGARSARQNAKVKTADAENGRRKDEGGRHGRAERKAKCKSQISKVKTGDGRS